MFFFFNDTATTEIYTLSLHDALPISRPTAIADAPAERHHHQGGMPAQHHHGEAHPSPVEPGASAHDHTRLAHHPDRKSTRLNSSHANISYAVFCLKKKKKQLPNSNSW